MSEMIERVAKAIILEHDIAINEAVGCARAAIASMREPTREMERAGEERMCTRIECACDETLIFQAMIDEALK